VTRIGCREAASLRGLERQPPSPPRPAMPSNTQQLMLKGWVLQTAMVPDREGSAPGGPPAPIAVPPLLWKLICCEPWLHEKTMAALWQLCLQKCRAGRTLRLLPCKDAGANRRERHEAPHMLTISCPKLLADATQMQSRNCT
jgi:hypothetical protein